jgi:hypothetical protein
VFKTRKVETMKRGYLKIVFTVVAICIAGVLLTSTSYAQKRGYSPEMQAKVDSMKKELKKFTDGAQTVERNLVTFDTLDYTVFSNQEWTRLHESHSMDVKVNWPDGHFTTGIEKHIEDLKALFVYAPDTRIKQHPIRFGDANGEWTCVTGVFEGTFTKPMPIGEGKFIQPTGKAFKMPMCTVGHWKDGVMIEESLFWDNATYMSQIGLGK